MKLDEFHQQFEIDRKAKGLRAIPIVGDSKTKKRTRNTTSHFDAEKFLEANRAQKNSQSRLFILLPMPPSVNAMYATGKDGKFFKSKLGNTYRQNVHELLQILRLPTIQGDLHVEYKLFLKRGGDLDGRDKALFDVLQGFAYKNDSQIKTRNQKASEKDKDFPRVEIEIVKLETEIGL